MRRDDAHRGGGRDDGPRHHDDERDRWRMDDDPDDDRPQDFGMRSIGFRGRMGQDYGYGGFGHMGQSDLYRDRHMGADVERGAMGRGMDRGFGGTDRGYGRERMSGTHGYGGVDRDYYAPGPSPSMRGKGPKNYARSDERIREEVCELLEDADLDASDIDVKVQDGEVVLEGTVDHRWAKREAEDIACRARGVKDCHNMLRIQKASARTDAESHESQTSGRNGSATNGRTRPTV